MNNSIYTKVILRRPIVATVFIIVFFVMHPFAQTNVALSKPVTISTVQTGNTASNAVDGNTSTRWCASSGSVPQWLMVDLGGSFDISRTEVMWEKTAVYKYKIETSPDNSSWTQRVDRTTNTASQQTFTDNFTITTRYVRITATSLPSGTWASIFEFRVFGNSATAAPVITTQPANLTVTEGQSATFRITATGNPAPTYQWRRNSSNISGATSTSYTITSAAITDSGAAFSCVVSNTAGSITSNNAVLTVQRNLRRQDSLALVVLYNNTDGPNWSYKTNWLTLQPIDTWLGVKVVSGRVTELILHAYNLTGPLVRELANLTALQVLDLSGNRLSGKIYSEFGNLKNLTSLDLSQNSLSDTIPFSLGNLSNLQSLILSENNFTGQIPVSISNLRNLETLYLNSNQLSGQIPSSLSNLINLMNLVCGNNQLIGTIPAELGNFKNLLRFSFPMNQLTGTIPSEIGNLSTLISLDLSRNRLTGSVPSQLGKLSQLESLLLNNNSLTNLPDSMAYLLKVLLCDLGNNQFCSNTPFAAAWANSHDPDWMSSQTCTNERRLDSLALVAIYNSTGGSNWTDKTNWLTTQPLETWYGVTMYNNRVYQLDLSFNNLSGSLPAELGNLTEAIYFRVQGNNISGVIPPQISNMRNLIWLDLAYNRISGQIPSVLGNLTNMIDFALASNQLTGQIPPELGNMTALVSIGLYQNNLTGQIPFTFGRLTQLRTLQIFQNSLTAISDSISKLTNLETCDLGYNQFCNISPVAKAWANAHDSDWASTQVCTKPGVQITATPLSGAAPLNIAFTASNIGSTMIENWNWSFGDGGTSNIQNPNHVYYNEGSFTARLIARGIGNSGYDTSTVTIQVAIPPAIVTQPVSQNVIQGMPVTFSVVASGTAPLSYQWRKNGVNITGGNDTTYSITSVQPADSGNYSVVVSNSAGSMATGNAILHVVIRTPRLTDSLALVALFNSTGGPNWTNRTNWLTTQPIDTWYGVTTDTGRIWHLYLDHNNLNGSIPPEIGNLTKLNDLALNNNLLSGLIPASLGNLTSLYRLNLTVNQLSGSIPSEIGAMHNLGVLWLSYNNLSGQIPHEIGNLRNLLAIDLSYNNLSGQIPAETGNLNNLTILSLQNNILSGAVPSHIGVLTQLSTLQLNNNSLTTIPDSIVYLSNISLCDLGQNQFCTLSPVSAAWANTHDPDWASSQSCAKPDIQITATPISGPPPLTVVFTVTNSGSTMIESWNWSFDDGGTAATQNPSHVYVRGGTFNARLIAKGIGNSGYDTAVIPITVYSPPLITTQPTSQSVLLGSQATFSVVATGSVPLSYQWYKNGTLISGATSSQYSIANVQSADSGNYSVVVHNVAGNITSAMAHLTVTPLPEPPVISRPPEPQTVSAGGSVVFSVVVTGTPPFSYAWQKNGNAVGGNTPALAIAPVAFADSGLYRVTVSNSQGSVISAPAKLSVVPVINTATNKQMCIRGMLYDTSGIPVGNSTTDTIETTVRLYNSLTGGTVQYTEFFRRADQHQITVKKGAFTINLGQGTTTDTLQSVLVRVPNLWIEITVDGSVPDVLTPRLPLTSSPHSIVKH